METAIVSVSSPGSAQVPVICALWLSFTPYGRGMHRHLGATLLTINSNVVLVCAPSLSVAVTVTVRLSCGPSVVAIDQFHVPSPLSTIVPVETLSVMVSSPGSE